MVNMVDLERKRTTSEEYKTARDFITKLFYDIEVEPNIVQDAIDKLYYLLTKTKQDGEDLMKEIVKRNLFSKETYPTIFGIK